jgi:hypothetical protein
MKWNVPCMTDDDPIVMSCTTHPLAGGYPCANVTLRRCYDCDAGVVFYYP